MEVNIHYAKTNLSQLILKVESGEDVIIARAGKPVVRLVPVEMEPQKSKRRAGALKGFLKLAPDAFSPEVDDEIAGWFNDSPLLFSGANSETPKREKYKHGHKKKAQAK